MGLILSPSDAELLKMIAERERAPFYIVGYVTGDNHFSFANKENGQNPIDLELKSLFGSAPKTTLNDQRKKLILKN